MLSAIVLSLRKDAIASTLSRRCICGERMDMIVFECVAYILTGGEFIQSVCCWCMFFPQFVPTCGY